LKLETKSPAELIYIISWVVFSPTHLKKYDPQIGSFRFWGLKKIQEILELPAYQLENL